MEKTHTRGIRRSTLRTAWDLYGSPGELAGAVRKMCWVVRHSGLLALQRAFLAKMRQPNMPLANLLQGPANHPPVAFEDRVDWPGRGLSESRSVSVIIPTQGNTPLLTRCLATMLRSTMQTARLDIMVINNGPPLHTIPPMPWPIAVRTETRAFNWSAYNNAAAAHSRADFLLFLNDDVEAIHTGWLDSMLAAAMSSNVAVVGAKLLYPDGTIQHMGITFSEAGDPLHIARHRPRTDLSPADPFKVRAVTGACLLTTRAIFQQLGGFDERFAFSYNDVDYCLRVQRAGHQVCVLPQAELVHLETATRPLRTSTREQRLFASLWPAQSLRPRGPTPFGAGSRHP